MKSISLVYSKGFQAVYQVPLRHLCQNEAQQGQENLLPGADVRLPGYIGVPVRVSPILELRLRL